MTFLCPSSLISTAISIRIPRVGDDDNQPYKNLDELKISIRIPRVGDDVGMVKLA